MPRISGDLDGLRREASGGLEVCGIPGAGKSTLVGLLFGDKTQAGVWAWRNDVVSYAPLSLSRRVIWILHPGIWVLAGLIFFPTGEVRARMRRGLVVVKEILKTDLRRNQKAILDQGILQSLSAFLIYCPPVGPILTKLLLNAAYARRWPALVILVSANSVEAHDSLGIRKKSASHNPTDIDGLEDAKALRALKKQASILEMMCGHVAQKTSIRRVRRREGVFQICDPLRGRGEFLGGRR